MQRLVAFLLLSRPQFLGGGVLLYSLGVLVARREGVPVDWAMFAPGQAAVTSVQLMTHYLNEWRDVDTDRMNANRTLLSGGSGMIGHGVVVRHVAMVAAVVSLAAAIVAFVAVTLAGETSSTSWMLFALILLGAWTYSGPPVPLAGSGIGEVTAALVVALLVPAFSYSLQAGGLGVALPYAAAPLVPLSWAMIVAFQFPDYEADMATGKRTFLVRVGHGMAARAFAVAVTLPLVLSAAGFAIGVVSAWFLASFASLAALGLGLTVVAPRVGVGGPVSYAWFTMGAGGLFGAACLALVIGFWLEVVG